MRYFEVMVASSKFHGQKTLIYSYEKKLSRGQIVTIPLRGTQVLGVINQPINKVDIPINQLLIVMLFLYCQKTV